MIVTMKELFQKQKLCAILRNVPMDAVLHYAEACYKGGICAFEVAMNTKAGDEQIKLLLKEFGEKDIYVGAGTVINEERCKRAADAGAQFFLTPSVARETLEFCITHKIPILPGVLTPTDVETCLEYGIETMKLFPAGDMPMNYIKSLKGPFDGTEYVAVGGIGLENLHQFFEAGFIGAGIGSNLIPKNLIAENKWNEAAVRVSEFVRVAGLDA